MLKSQEADEPETFTGESLSSAPQPRVTPDELSQALAAIEARRQAEANRLAGTIPIDQAVSELHLDATSEEIWVEVQAQRAKEAARREQRRQEKAARKAQAAQQAVAPRPMRRRGWTRFIVPVLVGWVLFHNGLIPYFGSHPTHTAAPILRSLAQVPDGQEVYADDSALAQVSAGKSLAQITISENATGNRWPLVKMGGHVYLRGSLARADSLQSLQGNALSIFTTIPTPANWKELRPHTSPCA